MKQTLAILAITALTGTFLVTAADPPAAGTADQGGGNRGNRGNFQGGRGGGGPGGGGGGGGRNFGGGFGALGLDDKQTELYREASEVNRDALTKLDEKLRAAQKELLQAVIAEKYDEAVVGTKAEAVAKIQTEMTLLRAKALSTIAPTLKPEQHEQLESSRMAASMLTGGGMGFGGFGQGGFAQGGQGGFGGPGGQGGQGGFGGPGNTGGNGFRGRGNQAAPPGSENIGGPGGGGGGGGQRRNRDRGTPATPATPQTPPTNPSQQ